MEENKNVDFITYLNAYKNIVDKINEIDLEDKTSEIEKLQMEIKESENEIARKGDLHKEENIRVFEQETKVDMEKIRNNEVKITELAKLNATLEERKNNVEQLKKHKNSVKENAKREKEEFINQLTAKINTEEYIKLKEEYQTIIDLEKREPKRAKDSKYKEYLENKIASIEEKNDMRNIEKQIKNIEKEYREFLKNLGRIDRGEKINIDELYSKYENKKVDSHKEELDDNQMEIKKSDGKDQKEFFKKSYDKHYVFDEEVVVDDNNENQLSQENIKVETFEKNNSEYYFEEKEKLGKPKFYLKKVGVNENTNTLSMEYLIINSDGTEEKYEEEKILDEKIQDKKKLFEKNDIKDMCKEIAGGRIKGLLLSIKVNPAIVAAIERVNWWNSKVSQKTNELLEGYITCLSEGKELPFELNHNLRNSKLGLFDKMKMWVCARAESKIPGTIVNFAERFWNKNKALPEGKNGKVEETDKEEKKNIREELSKDSRGRKIEIVHPDGTVEYGESLLYKEGELHREKEEETK